MKRVQVLVTVDVPDNDDFSRADCLRRAERMVEIATAKLDGFVSAEWWGSENVPQPGGPNAQ